MNSEDSGGQSDADASRFVAKLSRVGRSVWLC